MAFLAACGGDTIKLFDVRGGETGGGDPYTLQYAASLGLHINCAHWNHTNLVEASAGEDRKISLWLKSGRPLGTVPSNEGAPDIVEPAQVCRQTYSLASSQKLKHFQRESIQSSMSNLLHLHCQTELLPSASSSSTDHSSAVSSSLILTKPGIGMALGRLNANPCIASLNASGKQKHGGDLPPRPRRLIWHG
ncbi:hypothetical protein O6H91_16G090500 [Diphasiastrum complanatum]|uniref:Uncharacterized protein n=1 Tax=Diphasiastrum complanatum TaxID=34168 RepID=A0ACC2BES8_DIPCM|nr:hypothetical protein O6H91_16G090500 [Diphasiastrum complanatum]